MEVPHHLEFFFALYWTRYWHPRTMVVASALGKQKIFEKKEELSDVCPNLLIIKSHSYNIVICEKYQGLWGGEFWEHNNIVLNILFRSSGLETDQNSFHWLIGRSKITNFDVIWYSFTIMFQSEMLTLICLDNSNNLSTKSRSTKIPFGCETQTLPP